MRLNEFYGIINSYAPKSLSDEYCLKYGAYDNSGVIVDSGEDIKKALCSLDCSLKAIERAKKTGADVIFTHHPAIYGAISSLGRGGLTGERIFAAARGGLSVISMHLNLDCAENGIDYYLMEGVLRAAGKQVSSFSIAEPLCKEGTGYGRAYCVGENFSVLTERIGEVFNTDRVISYGENRKIERVASFCGAGADEKAIAFALKSGADAIISADFKHHIIAEAVERGLNVICLTHYASENYGFKKIVEKIIGQAGIPYEYFTNSALL